MAAFLSDVVFVLGLFFDSPPQWKWSLSHQIDLVGHNWGNQGLHQYSLKSTRTSVMEYPPLWLTLYLHRGVIRAIFVYKLFPCGKKKMHANLLGAKPERSYCPVLQYTYSITASCLSGLYSSPSFCHLVFYSWNSYKPQQLIISAMVLALLQK